MSEKKQFETTIIMTFGKLFGFLSSMTIPIFLSRWLTIDDYGVYRQVMLIYWFALMSVHMCVEYGLFFFIKSDPDRFFVYSLNVIFIDIIFSLIVCSLGLVFASNLANVLNSPTLSDFVPLLGLLVIVSLPAQHFEHLMLLLDKRRYAVINEIAFEMGKAIVTILGFYWFNSLNAVMWGLIAVSTAKLFALLTINLSAASKQPKQSLSLYWEKLKEQVHYGIPLGFSNIIGLLLRFDKFIISAMFSIREFTIYSVGCCPLPLIPNISNTLLDLMSFDMIEAKKQSLKNKLKDLWLTTTRKVFLIKIPLGVFCIIFAHKVITLIFSDQYAESAPYFQIFTLIFLLSAEDPDVVFRVFAQNKTVLLVQVASAIVTITLMIGGAFWLGPIGALVGKLVSEVFVLTFKVKYTRHYLDMSWRDTFIWSQIFGITTISVLSGGITYLVSTIFTAPKIIEMAILLPLFCMLVFLGSWISRLLHDDEKAYIITKAKTALEHIIGFRKNCL